MGIKTCYSSASTAEAAVQDIKQQAGGRSPRGVVYFASSTYDQAALSRAMQSTFDSATCLGCSTAGEIVSGKMLSNSVVAMLLSEDIIEDIHVELAKDIKSSNPVPAALERLSAHFDTPVAAMDIEKYVGIILVDGLSGAEERVMDTIGNLTDITFIGGSAGDDLKFQQTFVAANGEATSNAALLAILKVKKGFDIIKTQSFCSTGTTLTATEVNEAERRVIAFNNQPAVEAYAKALNCSSEDAANKFMSNPVGLMVGDEPYIRSPQRFDHSDIIFYCNIKKGMTLDVMEAADIVADTRQAVQDKLNELGTISGIIDFHCILRTLELRQKNLCADYGAIFSHVPTIGFSTYGEEYIGHVNQTSTMLVFK